MVETEVSELKSVQRTKNPQEAGEPGKWLVYLLLTIGLIIVVTPFIWMVLGSFKTNAELALNPPTWWPQAPTLQNYIDLFSKLNFPLYFTNSVIIAVFVTGFNLLFCSMLGYALAKLRFKGSSFLFGIVLVTLMVPGSVTMIPLFVIMSKFHLINSLTAVILPEAAGAFGVFLMRQFIDV